MVDKRTDAQKALQRDVLNEIERAWRQSQTLVRVLNTISRELYPILSGTNNDTAKLPGAENLLENLSDLFTPGNIIAQAAEIEAALQRFKDHRYALILLERESKP